jgi:hypothetical protein
VTARTVYGAIEVSHPPLPESGPPVRTYGSDLQTRLRTPPEHLVSLTVGRAMKPPAKISKAQIARWSRNGVFVVANTSLYIDAAADAGHPLSLE